MSRSMDDTQIAPRKMNAEQTQTQANTMSQIMDDTQILPSETVEQTQTQANTMSQIVDDTQNAPVEMSETMQRNIRELEAKKKEHIEIKKSIKDEPDERYLKRKTIGQEVKELESLICDELDDEQEIQIGRRKFKKSRIDKISYNKDSVQDFLMTQNISHDSYEENNKEEKVGLKAIKK